MDLSIIALFLLLVSNVVNCQDCDALDVGYDSPQNGRTLNYCQLDANQCCSNAFFNTRYTEISNMVRDEIRAELNAQIGSLGEIVDGMEDYLRTTFVPRFSRGFCSGLISTEQCDTAINDAQQNLLTHLYINEDEETDQMARMDENSGFSSAAVVAQYISGSIRGLIDSYLEDLAGRDITEEEFRCIHNYSLASPDQERYVYDNLTEVRKSFTALRRLRMHVNLTILPDILKIRPTNSCIESFINLTCRACVEELPDTCRGACNALMYGCLSPFREGLMEQFNLLWSITSQILSITNEILPQTSSLPEMAFGVDLDNANSVSELVGRCGITISGSSTANTTSGSTTSGSTTSGSSTTSSTNSTTSNDEDDTLPDTISELANRLLDTGAFNDSDPITCRDYENYNCWNGSANVTVNNIDFTDRTVTGQRNNPLATYNTTKLQEFAYSFDMFVTGYLRSPHFLDVAPETLVLPFNVTTNSSTGTGENNSAGIIQSGYLLLLAMMLFGLLIIT